MSEELKWKTLREQQRMYHLHARTHHRAECQCERCCTDGWELCNEANPCRACIVHFRRKPRDNS